MISFSGRKGTPGPETAIPAIGAVVPQGQHMAQGDHCVQTAAGSDPLFIGLAEILNIGFAQRLTVEPDLPLGIDCHAVAGNGHDPFDVGGHRRGDWMPGIEPSQRQVHQQAAQRACLVIPP